MKAFSDFTKALSQSERRLVAKLNSPERIQSFLDELAYNPGDERVRCPLSVLREGLAHCFEGAVFAAAVLRELGHPPVIVNMFPEPDTDDEHLIAIYRLNGAWGAVAKSNFVGLRFREPVYRSLRELVMAYFEQYYNLSGQKTLRRYTRPFELAGVDRHGWPLRDEAMMLIEKRLDALQRIPLLAPWMIGKLSLVDEDSCRRGFLGNKVHQILAPKPAHSGHPRRSPCN
jgi:hypothetical protein